MHYWDYTNGNRICSRVFYFFFHYKIFSQTDDIFIFIETGARGWSGAPFHFFLLSLDPNSLKSNDISYRSSAAVVATQIYSEGRVLNDPIEENLLFRGNPSYHCKDAIFVLTLGGMELKNLKYFLNYIIRIFFIGQRYVCFLYLNQSILYHSGAVDSSIL